jgi:hypothetical protein
MSPWEKCEKMKIKRERDCDKKGKKYGRTGEYGRRLGKLMQEGKKLKQKGYERSKYHHIAGGKNYNLGGQVLVMVFPLQCTKDPWQKKSSQFRQKYQIPADRDINKQTST